MKNSRQRKQKFVALGLEASLYIWNVRYASEKGYFNWTMSYRRDSDIWTPYFGYFQQIPRRHSENKIQQWSEIQNEINLKNKKVSAKK